MVRIGKIPILKSLQHRIRQKRLRLFMDRVGPKAEDRVLDVGGTPAVWLMPEASAFKVTLLNLTLSEIPESEGGRLESVVGDALDLPYAEGEFELGFSNSVIEHVGTWENQVRFAENIRRVSRDLWVQTPARCFFFEPHYITPFIHWIPRGIRGKFVRWFTVWGLFGRPSKKEVRERIDEIRLLNFKEMKTLFPDCEILRERWLGLTKGYMACRVQSPGGGIEEGTLTNNAVPAGRPNQETTMDLLRFTTAGSVDDGKSTLIGRLLHDSKCIFEDQLEAIEESSRKRGDENVNLALLTDGLRAEREQGITIDVAYRYFATPKRKFIIADTPGHIQYTRNMVTGASTANLAIILIDARKGVIEQTKRHSFIANLLRIQHVIVAVNKMDLVDYDEEIYDQIVKDYEAFASRLDSIVEIQTIPISALNGDNVVDKSDRTPWYQGPSLLYHLENVYVGGEENHVDARFPVQWVIRPQSDQWHDFRGYAGRVAGGVFKPGDEVMILPSGFTTQITAIHTADGTRDEAFAPQSVCITLHDEIDLSRGDMIVKPNNQPQVEQDIEAMVCWFSQTPMRNRGKYILRHTTRETKALVQEIRYQVDINTLHKIEHVDSFNLNEIGRIRLRTAVPLLHDGYRRNRQTGSFVLVDPGTNETVGAGMIV